MATSFEDTISSLGRIEDAIDTAVSDIRNLDRLMPTGARTFNGRLDDVLVAMGRVQAAAERLRQRSAEQRGQSEPHVPPPADVIMADGRS